MVDMIIKLVLLNWLTMGQCLSLPTERVIYTVVLVSFWQILLLVVVISGKIIRK